MATVSTASESGYEREDLTSEEKERLELTLDRSVEDTRSEGVPTLQEKIQEYYDEIEFAAQVARAQFDARFNGQNPDPNFFGVGEIRSGFFGYDSWFNTPEYAADGDDTISFIDDASPDNLNGDGGRQNPLRVGEDVVHVILGVGSLLEDSPTETVQFYKNDSPRSAIGTLRAYQHTDISVKWLDAPVIVAESDDLYAEAYSGTDGDEALYLEGFTFIKEKPSRVVDPASMAEQDFVKQLS